jgi:hypothetical protein
MLLVLLVQLPLLTKTAGERWSEERGDGKRTEFKADSMNAVVFYFVKQQSGFVDHLSRISLCSDRERSDKRRGRRRERATVRGRNPG